MNVLIVEDDDSVARFLRQALREAGFQSRLTGDGNEALELAAGRSDGELTNHEFTILAVLQQRGDQLTVHHRKPKRLQLVR